MRKAAAIAIMMLATLQPLRIHAEEPRKIHTTAYYQGTVTATGTTPRYGIAATDKQHIGYTAIIYARTEKGPGEILGIFECEDTGKGADSDGDGIGAIEEGNVIDIYFPTLEECKAWMAKTNGKVYVQYIEAKG